MRQRPWAPAPARFSRSHLPSKPQGPQEPSSGIPTHRLHRVLPLARRDHPHRCRPAQGKPLCPTSVGHLALRGGGAPVHRAWPSLSRKSWAVTSWLSAPGGAAPSLGSRTRVPALHRHSTRTGPSQLCASTNTTMTPAVAARGGHSPASRSEAVYSSLGQQLGTRAQSAGHCRPGGGRGGSERGHRAPERRRAGAPSPARLTTRDRTPLEMQGCCPPWASAQPQGRLPSTAQQVLPCAAMGKPDSKSQAEARPAPRNARGTLLQGVTTHGGGGGTRTPFQVQSSSAGTQRRGQRWPPC